jgi:hypothetical protein
MARGEKVRTMSTRSTRHGRDGARWPSSEACRRCAPVVFAALGVALAFALHTVTAQAAGRAAAPLPGPSSRAIVAAAAHAAGRAKSHDHANVERERTHGRRVWALTQSAGITAADAVHAHSPARATLVATPTADAGTAVAAGVEAAQATAQPAAAVSSSSRPTSSGRPRPTPPGEVPPVIATPGFTTPLPRRGAAFGGATPVRPLNVPALATLLLAVGVAISTLVVARRRG